MNTYKIVLIHRYIVCIIGSERDNIDHYKLINEYFYVLAMCNGKLSFSLAINIIFIGDEKTKHN